MKLIDKLAKDIEAQATQTFLALDDNVLAWCARAGLTKALEMLRERFAARNEYGSVVNGDVIAEIDDLLTKEADDRR